MQQLPDISKLMKIAQSPAGQKLLAMLQTIDSRELEHITSEATTGNWDGAKKRLSAVLSAQEAQELIKQLEDGL